MKAGFRSVRALVAWPAEIRGFRGFHSSHVALDEAQSEQPRRPEPKRPEGDSDIPRGSHKGKLIVLGAFGAMVAYGFYSHDEQKLRDLKFTPATEEPMLSVQKGLGPLIRSYGGVRQWMRDIYLYFADPPKPSLLPSLDLPNNARTPLTLVIDLDDTLVHTEWDRSHGNRTRRRPFTREFLNRMAMSGVEIVIFSTTPFYLTDAIVAALDPKGQFVHHRLGKEYTVYRDGKYIKDLNRLNRDLSRVVIIDDNPDCYSLHPENAIPISKWEGDKSDTKLRDLTPFLEYLASGKVKDVREELRQYEGRDIASLFKERAEKQIIKQKAISKMFGGTLHHDKTLPTASELLQTAKGDSTPVNAPTSPIPAAAPEAPRPHEGKFWAWLKRKNDQSSLEEQQLQEEWHRMQQQQQSK